VRVSGIGPDGARLRVESAPFRLGG
jgi:hypothetical protein